MELLTEGLRQQLPPLNAQEANDDPYVYARFYLSGTDREWYVIEGSPEDDDFRFFGYIGGSVQNFEPFQLSDLEVIQEQDGSRVQRDLEFKPGPFTDVVEAPE